MTPKRIAIEQKQIPAPLEAASESRRVGVSRRRCFRCEEAKAEELAFGPGFRLAATRSGRSVSTWNS